MANKEESFKSFISTTFNSEWNENTIPLEHELLKGKLVWLKKKEERAALAEGEIALFLESELDQEVKEFDDLEGDFVFTTIYFNEKLDTYFFKCALHLNDGSIYDLDTMSRY